jgi:hypothetical protein
MGRVWLVAGDQPRMILVSGAIRAALTCRRGFQFVAMVVGMLSSVLWLVPLIPCILPIRGLVTRSSTNLLHVMSQLILISR